MTAKGWGKICHTSHKHEKDAMTMLILDKIDLETRIDKEGHFVMKTMPTHHKT